MHWGGRSADAEAVGRACGGKAQGSSGCRAQIGDWHSRRTVQCVRIPSGAPVTFAAMRLRPSTGRTHVGDRVFSAIHPPSSPRRARARRAHAFNWWRACVRMLWGVWGLLEVSAPVRLLLLAVRILRGVGLRRRGLRSQLRSRRCGSGRGCRRSERFERRGLGRALAGGLVGGGRSGVLRRPRGSRQALARGAPLAWGGLVAWGLGQSHGRFWACACGGPLLAACHGEALPGWPWA